MRLRKLLKDKHGAMYVKACVLIIIISMIFSVAFFYTSTFVMAKAQRKKTTQALDKYTQFNAIEIYNSIKNHNDATDALNENVFIAYLCESQELQQSGSTLVSYTSDGVVRYKISIDDENETWNECFGTKEWIAYTDGYENTTKIYVNYILTVPLNFLGYTVWTDIPVSVYTSLRAKFDT